jgi:hypothetical protein
LTAGAPVGFLTTENYEGTIEILRQGEVSKRAMLLKETYTVIALSDHADQKAVTLQGEADATHLDHWVSYKINGPPEMLALRKKRMPCVPWDTDGKRRVAKHCVVYEILKNGTSCPIFHSGRVEQFIEGHYANGLFLELVEDPEFKVLFEFWSKKLYFAIGDMPADHPVQSASRINAFKTQYKEIKSSLEAFKKSFNKNDLKVAMKPPAEDYVVDEMIYRDSYRMRAEMYPFIPPAVKPTDEELAEIELKEYQERKKVKHDLAESRATLPFESPTPPASAPAPTPPKKQNVRRRRSAQDIVAGSRSPDSKVYTDYIDHPVSQKQSRLIPVSKKQRPSKKQRRSK